MKFFLAFTLACLQGAIAQECIDIEEVLLDNKADWTACASTFWDGFEPEKAFDGTDSFYHSTQEGSGFEYLQVDLGDSYMVTKVVVTGRSDCCNDRFEYLQVRVGNEDSNTIEGTGKPLSLNTAFGTSGPGPRTEFEAVSPCGKGTEGRYITIQKLAHIDGSELSLEINDIDVTVTSGLFLQKGEGKLTIADAKAACENEGMELFSAYNRLERSYLDNLGLNGADFVATDLVFDTSGALWYPDGTEWINDYQPIVVYYNSNAECNLMWVDWVDGAGRDDDGYVMVYDDGHCDTSLVQYVCELRLPMC